MEPPSTTPAIRVREDSPAWAATAGLPLEVNVLDYLIEAVMILDSEQRILFWSAAAERIYGVAPSAAHGRPWAAVVQPRWPEPTAEAAADQTLEQSGSWRGELIHQRCDGGAFPAEVRITILKTAAGAPAGRLVVVRDVSGRTRARRRLSDRDEQLREVQRLARLGSWEWDVAQDKITWSDELYRIYGLDRQEFRATFEGYLERVHPDDRASVRGIIEQAFRDGKPFAFEERIVRPDGAIRVLHSRGELITSETGQPERMVGTCQDITEPKRAAELVEREHAALEATMAALPDLLFEIDRETRIYDYRAPHPELLYAPPDQFVGKRMVEVLPAEAAQIIRRAVRAAATRGRHAGAVYALDLPGGRRWFELSIAAKGDRRRPDARFVMLARDVTDRVQAEEDLRQFNSRLETTVRERTAELEQMNSALRESEERFRGAFMNAMTGVALVAVDGRFLQVNPVLCDMAGYSAPELLQKTFRDLVHPDDLAAALALMRCLLTGELSTTTVEHRYLHKRGQVIWTHVNASLVRDGRGQPLYFVAQVQDVTERRHLEQAVLEARERERQQLAADLHDSLGQQLTGIAFLSKALQERLAVRAPAAAREAARIAKLTGAAIADTRELARHFDATAVETAGLVAALRTLATTTAGVFRIACLFKCPQPVVVTDSELAGQLYRIAQEAVSNAVRHARARHIVIRLTQRASELRLTITDDGRGFSPARVTSKGMGLRNMRQRARSIGGTLEIASRRGAGTTVRCCWKSPLTA